MAIKTTKLRAGVYQVAGTELTIERSDQATGWGEPTDWFVMYWDDMLCVAKSKSECVEALEIIGQQLNKIQKVDA